MQRPIGADMRQKTQYDEWKSNDPSDWMRDEAAPISEETRLRRAKDAALSRVKLPPPRCGKFRECRLEANHLGRCDLEPIGLIEMEKTWK